MSRSKCKECKTPCHTNTVSEYNTVTKRPIAYRQIIWTDPLIITEDPLPTTYKTFDDPPIIISEMTARQCHKCMCINCDRNTVPEPEQSCRLCCNIV